MEENHNQENHRLCCCGQGGLQVKAKAEGSGLNKGEVNVGQEGEKPQTFCSHEGTQPSQTK